MERNLPDGADLTNSFLLDAINAEASDLVDNALDISADVATFPLGTSNVTFTVTDDSGNSSVATTSLTVTDSQIVVTTLDDELDVDPELDLSDISLREAIAIANERDGFDSIGFDPGLIGTVTLDNALGQLEITETVSLLGLGRDSTIIDANGFSRVIDIAETAGDVSIDSVTVTGGRTTGIAEAGAGIQFLSDGTLRILNSSVTNNTTTGQAAAGCLLYTSPSPRDQRGSRMPSSA